MSPVFRVEILGAPVDLVTVDDLRDALVQAVQSGGKHLIANHNLHSLAHYHRSPEFRSLYAGASLVHVDGMSLIGLGKCFGLGCSRKHRVSYMDWHENLLGLAMFRGWRVFYVGAKEKTLRRALIRIRSRYPGLRIDGHPGYFDRTPGSEASERLLHQIQEFKPDLLLVGMGMPVQEQWIAQNWDRIEAHVVMNCGGFFDYLSGKTPAAPRWLARLGLEWLFRLALEPRRLWRRYLIEPLTLVKEIRRTRPLGSREELLIQPGASSRFKSAA